MDLALVHFIGTLKLDLKVTRNRALVGLHIFRISELFSNMVRSCLSLRLSFLSDEYCGDPSAQRPYEGTVRRGVDPFFLLFFFFFIWSEFFSSRIRWVYLVFVFFPSIFLMVWLPISVVISYRDTSKLCCPYGFVCYQINCKTATFAVNIVFALLHTVFHIPPHKFFLLWFDPFFFPKSFYLKRKFCGIKPVHILLY